MIARFRRLFTRILGCLAPIPPRLIAEIDFNNDEGFTHKNSDVTDHMYSFVGERIDRRGSTAKLVLDNRQQYDRYHCRSSAEVAQRLRLGILVRLLAIHNDGMPSILWQGKIVAIKFNDSQVELSLA